MAIIAGNFPQIALAAGITLILAGCGLTQKVTDGTVAVTKSIFYKQIKTLHLDIRAREAVNSNAGGVALSTVVRIYQLKDRKTFDTTDYPSLFKADSQAIKADLMPGTAHELMGALSAVLLKYEPRLKKIDVVLLEQTIPGELRYAIDAELRGIGLVRYGTAFMPEGRVLIRYLKQQQYLDAQTHL